MWAPEQEARAHPGHGVWEGTDSEAQVPMAEMFKYSIDLRAITGGRATFTTEFSHYEEVPANVAAGIIEQAKKEREKES